MFQILYLKHAATLTVSSNSVVLKPGYHQNYIGSFIGLLILNYLIKSSDLFKSSKILNP